MTPMNMAGLNAGNPGMGGMPMMNRPNGAVPGQGGEQHDANYEARLNTYIYGYFLEKGQWDVARVLKNSGVSFEPPITNNDTDVNGADDAVMRDSKDGVDSKRPHDLPSIKHAQDEQSGSFLLGWFSLFWDIYFAQKKRPEMSSTNAMQYITQTVQRTKQRNEQQAMLRNMPGMMPGQMEGYNQGMMRFNNGMGINGDLRQKALQNNRNGFPTNPAQIAQMRNMQLQQQQQQQQQHMRREPSDMNGNGQRPHTPSGADHAPSPSKRQRLTEGVPFNGQHGMPNGRPPPGMPGQPPMHNQESTMTDQLLINNNINPATLSEQQYQSFTSQTQNVQQKSIQVYAQNLAKSHRDSMSKVGGMSDGGSPLMATGMELNVGGAEFYAGNNAAGMQLRPGPQNPGQNGAGNHALQDYQMQLMLLEQQNKKRLLMARQEADNGSGMPSGPGFASGTSPQGRGGPSPGPGDPTRRGTPKSNQAGMPGSPLPDGSMRASPGTMNFNSLNPEMYPQMNGAPGMRPPGSNPAFNAQFNPGQMDVVQRQGAQRMPNGGWQQGPPGQAQMMQPQNQQQPQPPPQQMGTSQQRKEMPPPQGPPPGATANGRPSSPAAPATPQPPNKANPKGKKDQKKREKPTKKNSTSVAATPAAEAENPPATTTPSTPITPSAPHSLTQKNEAQNQAGAITTVNPTTAPQLAPPPPDPNAGAQYGIEDVNYDSTMTFNNDPNDPNLMEHFDFEQFLDGTAFSFDPTVFDGTDGIEASIGEPA